MLAAAMLAAVRERVRRPPEDGGVWTAKKVAAFMATELGRQVAGQRGWEALRATGRTIQSPRPRRGERTEDGAHFGDPVIGRGLGRGTGPWFASVNLLVNVPAGPCDEGSVFATCVIDTGNPALSFGVGPLVVAPTATDDPLGSGKWQLGVANVLFNASIKVFRWGYLVTWQASVAGDDDRDDVSLGAFQPFAMYQLGSGWYARSTGVWTYDFEHDYYAILIGMGLCKVIPSEKAVCNVFVEQQYSGDTKGPGQPDWQVFFGFNLQFTGGETRVGPRRGGCR